MIAVRSGVLFISFLPSLAAAEPPAEAERSFAAKLAVVEQASPIERGELPVLLPPEAEALGCGLPCVAGVLGAAHPYYDVFLNCGDGAFTARTGVSHSVTAAAGGFPQNVIFGGSSGSPGTSDISFFVHETATQYLNPPGGSTCLYDPLDTPTEPLSVGLEQEWSVTNAPGRDLTFRQELVAFGSTEANSGVRMTLSATNRATSTLPATIGFRWQIDYQNGPDDGPLFAAVTCDPPALDRELFGEHDLSPAEIKDFYRIQNNFGFPIFSNVTSTTALSGIPDTDRPDRLLFGVWGPLSGSPWGYAAVEGDPGVDSDSAVLYYFGYQSGDAFVLAPGQSVTRSVVIFTSSAGVDCGDFVPGCASEIVDPPQDRAICRGETTTLDCSGIGLLDCVGAVEHEWRDSLGLIGNTALVDVSPDADGSFSCTVTCSSDPDCSARQPVFVEVHEPPVVGVGAARDLDPCNEGVLLSWDPAEFFGPSGRGLYNIYRSTVDCADAVASPPLVTGLDLTSWSDASAVPGLSYHYVVEAEDERSPSACTPGGADHGGGAARLCLAPVVDRTAALTPPGVGAVLFVSHDAHVVELRWPSARALDPGEHFHLLKARNVPDGGFFLANPEADLSLSFSETDETSRLQFFDLRVADVCESISEDEFPASH